MNPAAKSRLTIVIIAVAALLFFLHILGALSEAEAWLMRGLSPQELKLTGAAKSLRQLMEAPFHLPEIISENVALRQDRDSLATRVAKLHDIEAENAQLRESLKFAKRSPGRLVMANVLTPASDAEAHALLIDRGSDDGLANDMPVIVGDGILIGKIIKAEKSTAYVLLLTDSRSRVGASIQNAAGTQGVVQGERGLSMRMQLIPQNEAVAESDLIVTSGIEPLIPKGLVIGRVSEIQSQEKKPFKTASIVPFESSQDVSVVAVPIQ